MKTAGICAVAGLVAFLLMGLQLGLLGRPSSPPENQPAPEPSKTFHRAPFPQTLAPACRGLPVPQAAEIKRVGDGHPMVFLLTNGTLHSWQEDLKPAWQAESVEDTQYVVVLGPQRKIFVSIQTYPNGAPPVSRYKYELDASVVEAKSGRVLAYKRFITQPRPVKSMEAWELTAIGEPVTFQEVYHWAAALALQGGNALSDVASPPRPVPTGRPVSNTPSGRPEN